MTPIKPNSPTSLGEPLDLSQFADRIHERFEISTPVVFEVAETHSKAPGILRNYSKGGMYVEAECSPRKGTGALIHMVNYSPNASEPEDLNKYYVQVKWITPLPATPPSSRWGIGVKLCTRTEELFRLFKC